MIELRNLSKAFGKQKVLDNLNLQFNAGERVALIGQNGSGKTTLIRCLLGLYTHEGLVAVQGKSLRWQRESGLREIAFVPQLPPGMRLSVKEYLHMANKLTGVAPESVAEICSQLEFDLEANNHKLFVALSGGMKQKLMIATALARKPSLLIMDEPAANLDPRARAKFYAALNQLPSTTTMLLSSHRLDEIAGLVTRLVELDHGKVVLDDIVTVGHSASKSPQNTNSPSTQTLDFFLCQLLFSEINESIIAQLKQWGLHPDSTEKTWKGRIAGPDRFRFVSMLTRWSASIEKINMESAKQVEPLSDTLGVAIHDHQRH